MCTAGFPSAPVQLQGRIAAALISHQSTMGWPRRWSAADAAGVLAQGFAPAKAQAEERQRMDAMMATGGPLQALRCAADRSGSTYLTPVLRQHPPLDRPKWSAVVSIVPARRHPTTREPLPLDPPRQWDATSAEHHSNAKGAVHDACAQLLRHKGEELAALACDDRPTVPSAMLCEHVLRRSVAQWKVGEHEHAGLMEAVNAEQWIALDSEWDPAKIVQVFCPAAESLFILRRDSRAVSELLASTSTTIVVCDKASEEAHLRARFDGTVIDIQALAREVFPGFADRPGLTRLSTMAFLADEAKLEKEPPGIFAAFAHTPPHQLSRRHLIYAGFDAVATGLLYEWLSRVDKAARAQVRLRLALSRPKG